MINPLTKSDNLSLFNEDQPIALSQLLARLAVELNELARSSQELQLALGRTMDQVADVCAIPIMEFQALDRLQQKLQDIKNLTELMSDATFNAPEITIPEQRVYQALTLNSFAERLTGKSSPNDTQGTPTNPIGSFTLF